MDNEESNGIGVDYLSFVTWANLHKWFFAVYFQDNDAIYNYMWVTPSGHTVCVLVDTNNGAINYVTSLLSGKNNG